jgi:hypothetical protein
MFHCKYILNMEGYKLIKKNVNNQMVRQKVYTNYSKSLRFSHALTQKGVEL